MEQGGSWSRVCHGAGSVMEQGRSWSRVGHWSGWVMGQGGHCGLGMDYGVGTRVGVCDIFGQ
jgi:hypothetical protein